jgi:putative ABC transport system permease protein
MPTNYLKITARRLLRHKAFSLINVFGLAAGLAACLLIYLYVYSEVTYDAYNPKASRIVRVTSVLHTTESDLALAACQQPLAAALRRDFPEVEATTRILDSMVTIRQGNEVFRAEHFCYSEQSIFSLFAFSFLEGTAGGALTNPRSIVLTRSMEKKYFGDRPALGQTMICNGESYRVTAVVADRPGNSDLTINALLYKDFNDTHWMLDDFDTYTFVLFRQKPDLRRFDRDLSRMDKYTQPVIHWEGQAGWTLHYSAELLTDVHFSEGKVVDTTKGDRRFNKIFSALAVFILIIALLNYINLSTARAADRMKEVGVRKVIGAHPGQLIRQFLTESSVLVAIAWIIAVGLVASGIPLFNRTLDTRLTFSGWGVVLFPVLLFPVTVLLAGAYPAFVLSRFRPIAVLKSSGVVYSGGASLRKVFTVVQFVIALAMLAGVVVFYQQMYFVMHNDPGVDRSGILEAAIPADSTSQTKVAALYQAVRGLPGVSGASLGSGLPSQGVGMTNATVSANGNKKELLCNYFLIDPQFLPLVHIPLAAGRNVSDSFATDRSEAFIVNEAFVKMVGWSSPIGQTIDASGTKGKVIGVVKNFFYKSMHNLIEPMIMLYPDRPPMAILVKTDPSALSRLKQVWRQFYPAQPFHYVFMDEDFNEQYQKDRATMFLFNVFTALAIIISCLGLYGLVSLLTLRRAKEIAVRKVLGASIRHLLVLLSTGQLQLIGLAAVIALPLAALGAQRWVNTYAYHVAAGPWMFVLPLVALLLLTLAVTGYRIMRAAVANPVAGLRSE